MIEIEKIELRSEKVRTLIGQIPPIIIRIGISVIFSIILLLLIGSWFFKYEYIIKTNATITQTTDSLFIYLKIPANEINKLREGQKVILNFNNIPNLYNEKILTETQTIPNTLEITESGGFYTAEIKLSNKIKTETEKSLFIKEKTNANAEIVTEKISLFNRIIEPIMSIFNKRK